MNEIIATIHAKFLIAISGTILAGIVSFIILDDEKIKEKRKSLKGKQKLFFNIGVLTSEIFISVFSGMFMGVPLAIQLGQDENGVVMFAIIASLLGRKLIASVKSGGIGESIINMLVKRAGGEIKNKKNEK